MIHYSSPELSSGGEACGNESTANNARVLEENFVATTQRRAGVEALGVVSFAETAFSGNEEDGVVITLQRDGDLSQAASVKLFAKSDTAEWGVDFVDAYVLAEFEPGAATAEVSYPIVKDGESESTESFSVTMKYAYKLSVGDVNSATVNVADGAQTGTAGMFSVTGPSELNEGDSGVYVVTRVGGTGEAVVNVSAVAGSAVAGSDYVALNEQLVFAEGEVEKSVTLVTVDDQKAETKESLTVEIYSPSDTAEYDVKSVDVGVIDNDDVVEPDAGSFALSASATSVSEAAGSVTLTVTRSGGSEGTAVVRVYTVAGTAIAGTDFTALDQELTFAEGEVEKSVTLVTVDDQKAETKESLTVEIYSPSDTAEYDVKSVDVGVIDNDDVVEPDAGSFALSASATSVSEAAGSVTLTVTRSGGSEGTAVVRVYTVAGTAIAGTDFTALDQELTFADGETEKTLILQILDDSDDESGNASFDVVLEGAGVEVTTSTVTITLTDNDNASSGGDTAGNTGSEKSGGSTGLMFILLSGVALLRKKLGMPNSRVQL